MLDYVVTHDEADVTLCSYMLKSVGEGSQTIHILSGDTDVFIILVYWTTSMLVVTKIQMEQWNGDVLDINETVQQLSPRKCSKLLSIHTVSGCDTVSYPSEQGKKSGLKLLAIDIPCLYLALDGRHWFP